MAQWKITWLERGSNNAACIGEDATVEHEGPAAAILADAFDHADQAGIDLTRYEPIVEPDIESLGQRLDTIEAGIEVEGIRGTPDYVRVKYDGGVVWYYAHYVTLWDYAHFHVSGDFPETRGRMAIHGTLAEAMQFHTSVR